VPARDSTHDERDLLSDAARPVRTALVRMRRFVLGPVALLWVLELIDQLLVPRPGLDVLGIRPRTLVGLRGILLAPWLHAGFAHVAANTLPLLVLATVVLTRGVRELLRVTLGVVLLGGLGVWLFGGPGTVHLGASGLLFGYLGFLLSVGWFERHPVWIVVSLAIASLYGGLVLGVLPGTPGISWESHLFGFVSGVLLARGRRRLGRSRRV